MTAPKLLFLATEDWFVLSHFMPLLRRAQQDGFDVVVAARSTGVDLGPGVRLIDTPFARGSLRPWDVGAQLSHLRALLDYERPAIVHAIALKAIALLLLTRYRTARVLALTGRGYLGVSQALWTQFANWQLKRKIAAALREPRTLLLTENEADRAWLGATDATSVVMPGAGVDPTLFQPAPEPAHPPIIVGVIARLIWSKGIDLAVDAVRRLRESGVDVALRIAGAADPQNPEHVPDAEIARWGSTPGVEVVGKISDVNGFWRGAHIACLPSRGGEGLPRSLLEAAACGRPIVTSDAPGCADFAEGVGIATKRGDVDALVDALRTLALDAGKRQRLGAAGRAKVMAGYTEEHAAACASQAWRRVLGR
jgi:glycosyltransferase involved in cell wall biosynthesis